MTELNYLTDQEALDTYHTHNVGCSGLRCDCEGCKQGRRVLAERDAKIDRRNPE